MAKALLSIADLHELLTYNPATGDILWKERTAKWFASTGHGGSEGACARWNGRLAGKPALNVPAATGHLAGAIFRVSYRAPRVAWALFYGEWPTENIDHVDGNPRNNRIENLRDVSHQINMMNRSKQRNNTSGITGVCRHGSKWWASIKHEGKKRSLGFFNRIEDAAAARQKAERELGFSPRHGL